jgi:hypothetical protein
MQLLAKLLLNVYVDKEQQISDWSGELSKDQIKYAADDAAISLELYEKLDEMPDLTRRLTKEELVPSMKVDIVPRHGRNVATASLSTRAASAEVIGTRSCACPSGIVPKVGSGNMVKPCPNSCVVKVTATYSPAFIIPGYKMKDNNEAATIGDIGLNQEIVVPIDMLRNHFESRATPTPTVDNESRPTPPASESSPPRNASSVPNITPQEDEDGKEECDETDVGHDFNVDDCDGDEFVDYDEFIAANESAHMYGATSADEVSWLRAVIIEGEKGISGKTILPCDELDKALMPWEIRNQIGRDAAVCPVIFCAELSCSAGPRGLHFHLLYLLVGSKCISLLSFPR